MESKIALTMGFDDRFFKGGAVMIHSLKKHLSNFDKFDFKVFYSDEVCQLSEENKNKLRKIHSDIIFEKIDQPAYSNCDVMYEKHRASFLAIECFNQTDYDKVVFFDADMLCIGDFYDVIEESPSDMVSGCGYDHTAINTGFFIVGSYYLQKEVYDTMIDNLNNYGKQFRHTDQFIINETIGNFRALPWYYNWSMDRHDYKLHENTKIIEWSGALPASGTFQVKPWEEDELETTLTSDGRKLSEVDHVSLNGTEANNLWNDSMSEIEDIIRS